ncbi:hypothetical protein B0H13DRAFT_589449 [Mycena leptocephala]|nr:hypothetical protein B0H13DRAFT_589449 [Mycena leptocephala]
MGDQNLGDADKVEALGLGLASGSPADAWFDDPAQTAAKATWATISAAFDAKWPKRAALKRVGQDAIEDLFAEQLKVEDIGKRVKHGGVEEFGHVVWVRKVARIAGDIPDPNGLFIGVVLEKLPMVMRELLVPGTSFTSWGALETAVVDLKQAAIVHAKAKEARIEMAVKPTPRHAVTSQLPAQIHPQHFSPQPYPSYPQFIPPAPRPVTFAPPQQPAQAAAPPRSYRPDTERLMDLEKNVLIHHPPTDAGRVAYQKQIADWHSLNAPLDSRGECFNCALLGHMTNECPNPAMPPLEKKWRQIAASIRNGASGVPRRNAVPPAPIHHGILLIIPNMIPLNTTRKTREKAKGHRIRVRTSFDGPRLYFCARFIGPRVRGGSARG